MNTERLILETKLVRELNGIIQKLNNEVDMLTKQKVFLQSKLKKKGDTVLLVDEIMKNKTQFNAKEYAKQLRNPIAKLLVPHIVSQDAYDSVYDETYTIKQTVVPKSAIMSKFLMKGKRKNSDLTAESKNKKKVKKGKVQQTKMSAFFVK